MIPTTAPGRVIPKPPLLDDPGFRGGPYANASQLHVTTYTQLRAALESLYNEPDAVVITWQRKTGTTTFRFPPLADKVDGVVWTPQLVARNSRVRTYLSNLAKLPRTARQ